MTSLPKRLTSLAIVIALSGSPVVLSACMALCLQGMATAASDTDSQSAHAAHVTAAVPAGASAHAHHASPVSNESAATGPATASCHASSAAAPLRATCTNCCPEGPAILLEGLGVERTDTTSFSATPIASFLVTLPGLGASPPSLPVPPPSPTRALLILRI